MKIVQLTTDNREAFREYSKATPHFGPAPEALLQGFSCLPEVEVHVISCAQRPMHSPEKLSENIWFHSLHVPKGGWLRTGYQGCVRAIRRKVRELRPDVVHGQGTERECALGAVFSGFPNVVTIHGNMEMLARLFHARTGSYLWFASILERLALPRTLGVFCNSAYTEAVVQKRVQGTFRVPNAVRLEFFEVHNPPVTPRPKPLLLNIGVISKRKRQLEILELAEDLRKEGYDFEIQFVGVANSEDSYAAAFLSRVKVAEEEGLARYFSKFSVRDLIAVMDEASALIHAPSEEAFGLVVAEALARNLKVFATDVGGIPDIAKECDGAELFALEDERSLRIAISRWISRTCPRPDNASALMKERYHPAVVAGQHLAIYEEILNSGAIKEKSAR